MTVERGRSSRTLLVNTGSRGGQVAGRNDPAAYRHVDQDAAMVIQWQHWNGSKVLSAKHTECDLQ